MMEFQSFPKIKRYEKPCIVTEKIDGTNAQIGITIIGDDPTTESWDDTHILLEKHNQRYAVQAGSRNRWLTEDKDNFNFFSWVKENAHELVDLGPGRHYGEWWGQGINRGYDLEEKCFSLFNTPYWNQRGFPDCCFTVPELGEMDGLGDIESLQEIVSRLQERGSAASPGYAHPEGVVIFHRDSNTPYKYILDK